MLKFYQKIKKKRQSCYVKSVKKKNIHVVDKVSLQTLLSDFRHEFMENNTNLLEKLSNQYWLDHIHNC